MRLIVAPLLVLLLLPLRTIGVEASFPSGWPNLAKPPAASDSAAILANGWAASRDVLAAALAKNYRPGANSPGSTGNTTFRAWLTEWQWCELLARDSTAESKRFLSTRLTLLPSGYFSASTNAKPISDPAAAAKLVEQLTADPHYFTVLNSVVPLGRPSPSGEILGDLVPDEPKPAWTADVPFLQTFFATLSQDDYTPLVLRNLAEIYQAQRQDFHDYAALAIALAVVYDVRTPSWWPHHQVSPNLVPKKIVPLANRFAFWVKSNRSGVLVTDLRKLPAEQLKFVVDAPLDESELIWAQDNAPHAQAEFYRTFGDIKYDTYRLMNDVTNWRENTYTLANIQEYGGICIDQAYFAAVCGKAVGLPTLLFDGFTSQDGSHAWFGYLKSPDQWALDCGRYASFGIATGKAYDPQTWNYITDHELAYLSDGFHKKPAYVAAEGDLVMAKLLAGLGDNERTAKALDSAIAICPGYLEAWMEKDAFLESNQAKPMVLRTFYEAAIKQFARLPDAKVEWQLKLAALCKTMGDQQAAAILLTQIGSQNQASRADLALVAAAVKISGLVKAGNLTGAVQEFMSQAQNLGSTAGSELFYRIAQPLALRALDAGNVAAARQVVQRTREVLKPQKSYPIDLDLTELEKRINNPVPKKTTPGKN